MGQGRHGQGSMNTGAGRLECFGQGVLEVDGARNFQGVDSYADMTTTSTVERSRQDFRLRELPVLSLASQELVRLKRELDNKSVSGKALYRDRGLLFQVRRCPL